MQKPKQEAKTSKLGKHSWLSSGLKMLGERGLGGLRIDALCTELGVTKGSFYWHFKDREDLMQSMLAFWSENETRLLISRIEAVDAPPEQRLWALIDEVSSSAYDASTEFAIRHWARNDKMARDWVSTVDTQRLAFYSGQLRALGFDEKEAEFRGFALYSATLSQGFIFKKRGSDSRKEQLRTTLNLVLGAVPQN